MCLALALYTVHSNFWQDFSAMYHILVLASRKNTFKIPWNVWKKLPLECMRFFFQMDKSIELMNDPNVREKKAECLPSLRMWWEERIRYSRMLLTFKRRRCFVFLSNRINSLFIHLLFRCCCRVHEARNCLKDWNTISLETIEKMHSHTQLCAWRKSTD